MKRFSLVLKPAEIVAVTGGEYRGEDNRAFDSVSDPESANPGSVVFLEQDKYLAAVQSSNAGLLIAAPNFADKLSGRDLLIHPQPYLAFLRLTGWWLERCAPRPKPGVHPTAIIASGVTLGKEISIGPHVIIGGGCVIGEGVALEAFCTLGENVSIGAGSRLYPRVTVYDDCRIGHNAVIHSGAVIGADGFGFILHEGIQRKIPQIGSVVIEDNVEIGANSCIDRGTLSPTTIGEGTKIDNLVQIGHNCMIGKHCIICAQAGLAGSVELGDYVYLAGQTGVADHLRIGDRARVGAQSGVSHDLSPETDYFGTPAIEVGLSRRIVASLRSLPEMYRAYGKQKKEQGEQ